MQKKLSIYYVLLLAVVFTSCIKKEVTPLGDEGSTFVKILGGGNIATTELNNFIDFVPNSQKILAVDIRRDAANNADLNKSVTVVIKDDTAAVRATNAAYENFPAAWYTLETDAVKSGGLGGNYTMTFKPGEFAKQIYLVIPDATVMSPSSTYAMGFTITSVDNDAKVSSAKSMVVTIGAKNAYDGVYENDFTNYHPSSNPGYTGDVVEVHMVTTSATTCKIYFPDFGGFYCPAVLGGSLSAFGAQEPAYTVDPLTNKVTVQNAYVGAVTFYTMAAGYDSRYDPSTRTYYVKWGYNYDPGGIFNPANNREWTQKLKYLRPR